MLEFIKREPEEKPTSIHGEFIIKGVIHITHIDEKEIDFESIHEQFFYTGLEKDGHFLSQGDIDVYLEHELKNYDWGFEPELDKCYSVLFQFELVDTSGWTACGYEYDSSVECTDLHILPVSEKATKWYLEPVEKQDFQFEE